MNIETELDIRVFNTVSGRQIIGELVDVQDGVVSVAFAMNCETIISNDGSGIKTLLTPCVPYDDGTNMMSLYMEHIESEICANRELEEIYVEHVISNNIGNSSYDIFESNDSLPEQDDYWKQFKDRFS